ncbi:hypothetical protein HMPREF9072_01594 [Capnocytophaga sp. oral taxon 324 str. F0483]|nr:hypothetical protein HMPREF9072_01594 [Capnocytophaga sp. oral taxon 324 str. F0483]
MISEIFKTMNAIQFFQWGLNNNVEITFSEGGSLNSFSNFSIRSINILVERIDGGSGARVQIGKLTPSAKSPLIWGLKRELLLNLNEYLDYMVSGLELEGTFEGSIIIEDDEESAGVFFNYKNRFPAEKKKTIHSSFERIDNQTLSINFLPKEKRLTLKDFRKQLTKIVIPKVYRLFI